jgi:thymidylate synthase (FAD)
MNKVRLVAMTQPVSGSSIPDTDGLLAYCARVSSPQNQDNWETAPRLLAYCAEHKHWSVFEMASVELEIETTRAISHQLLRHRSLHFQEFSQRYSDVSSFVLHELRLAHPTNRQMSVPCDNQDWKDDWIADQENLMALIYQLQETWQERGIAKEVLRNIYPEGLTMTRLYAHGTVRDWWHYCQLRMGHGTQSEHADLAQKINAVLAEAVPETWQGLMGSIHAD